MAAKAGTAVTANIAAIRAATDITKKPCTGTKFLASTYFRFASLGLLLEGCNLSTTSFVAFPQTKTGHYF